MEAERSGKTSLFLEFLLDRFLKFLSGAVLLFSQNELTLRSADHRASNPAGRAIMEYESLKVLCLGAFLFWLNYGRFDFFLDI